jgi:hypothetical protein
MDYLFSNKEECKIIEKSRKNLNTRRKNPYKKNPMFSNLREIFEHYE